MATPVNPFLKGPLNSPPEAPEKGLGAAVGAGGAHGLAAPLASRSLLKGHAGVHGNSTRRPKLPKITKGALLSTVPGRTDQHASYVPAGSYVIPADIVSGRGEGNTLAGVEALSKLFKLGPYGTELPKGRADGGPAPDEKPVRVDLAGGEVVVPPESLRHVVNGDLKQAHRIMDAWVLRERKLLQKTLASLPGPAKD